MADEAPWYCRGRPNGLRVPPEVRQRFLGLIHEGVSIREASRIVGINRRTGQEWLNGRAERVTARGGGKTIRAAVQPLVGAKNGSAIGTLVERSTRYTLLMHLPHGHTPGAVQTALLETVEHSRPT